MNENKTWSKEEVFALIHQWKIHPELWDVKHQQYRNKVKKQVALKGIATAFGTTENEIYRKFHNLRTQFHQELRRIKIRKSLDETYKSAWKFFDAMKFIMLDHCNNSKALNLKEETEDENENDDSGYTEFIDAYKEPEVFHGKIHQISTEDSDPISLVKRPQLVEDANKSVDEFKVFGDFVASELRNLRSRENQNRLKRMIQRSILEISELDDNENVF